MDDIKSEAQKVAVRIGHGAFTPELPEKLGLYWVRENKSGEIYPIEIRMAPLRFGNEVRSAPAYFVMGWEGWDDIKILKGKFEFAEIEAPQGYCYDDGVGVGVFKPDR